RKTVAHQSILSQLTIQFQMRDGVNLKRVKGLMRAVLNEFVPHDYAGRPSEDVVPEVGLEPTHLSILHFECNASTNSAIRAGHLTYFTQVFRITKRRSEEFCRSI